MWFISSSTLSKTSTVSTLHIYNPSLADVLYLNTNITRIFSYSIIKVFNFWPQCLIITHRVHKSQIKSKINSKWVFANINTRSAHMASVINLLENVLPRY